MSLTDGGPRQETGLIPPARTDSDSPADGRAAATANSAVLGNPAALGLVGFAVANLMLNLVNSGWLPESAVPAVLPLAFFGGGLAQLVAAIGECRRGDTFGTTAFGSYAVFWFSLWGFLTFEQGKFTSPAAAEHALAAFLACWLIWTVLVWIASFRVSVVLNLLFLDLIGVLACQSAGLGLGNTTLVHLGGYLGIALSAIGFYGAFETIVNETFGRTVIPNRKWAPEPLR